ncbi:MAG: preprotein translocase subunit SecE [Clostridia bacterium]|nr:preprotein translocase subunit SecE [Clostridia bacterium]
MGSGIKEIVSELKKVTWPTFGKVMAETGIVLVVVLFFLLVILGFDSLLSWLFSLLVK